MKTLHVTALTAMFLATIGVGRSDSSELVSTNARLSSSSSWTVAVFFRAARGGSNETLAETVAPDNGIALSLDSNGDVRYSLAAGSRRSSLTASLGSGRAAGRWHVAFMSWTPGTRSSIGTASLLYDTVRESKSLAHFSADATLLNVVKLNGGATIACGGFRAIWATYYPSALSASAEYGIYRNLEAFATHLRAPKCKAAERMA